MPHRSTPLEILLIEDHEPTCAAIKDMLEDAGHHVVYAASRPEVLTLIELHPYDLAITDVIMPEIDGVEVIQALRRHRPDVPIIAISGGGNLMTSSFSLELAKGLGVDVTLEKPFGLENLLNAIDLALEGKPPQSPGGPGSETS